MNDISASDQVVTVITAFSGHLWLRWRFQSYWVLHQNEAGRYWEIHPETPETSQGSREIWRAEGMDFPIPPEFWWSTDNLSASIFLQGVDQKILPCGQGRIDSVKINPSLLMMTDCLLHQFPFCCWFLVLHLLRPSQAEASKRTCRSWKREG